MKRIMDIQKLTDDYRTRFEAFYGLNAKNIPEQRSARRDRPNYLAEVIRPILDALVDILPEYGFVRTTDEYAMFGEYYRIKRHA